MLLDMAVGWRSSNIAQASSKPADKQLTQRRSETSSAPSIREHLALDAAAAIIGWSTEVATCSGCQIVLDVNRVGIGRPAASSRGQLEANRVQDVIVFKFQINCVNSNQSAPL